MELARIEQDEMNFNALKQLVSKGESHSLEFKRSTSKLKSAAEALCGFLNDRGGTVLIGVSDNKQIVGLDVTDQTQQEVAATLRQFEPTANISVDYVDIDGNNKKVIVMTAYPDKNSIPYTFRGRAYERNGSTTSQMPQARYHQLLLQKSMTPILWDEMVAEGVTIDELDYDEIRKTLNEGVKADRIQASFSTDDPKPILEKLQLIQSNHITNAAVVLFMKEVRSPYLQCVLRIARFKGTEKGSFIDSKHVFGNVFQLLREAETFISRTTAIASRFEDGNFQRIDEPEYHHKAVREAIVNALCHRDYSLPGGSVAISIYDDRLEIASSGTLPNNMTVEALTGNHSSHPRNRLITNVFFRRGLIEAFGTGIHEIVKSCDHYGVKAPEFFEQAGTFVVRLWSKHYEQPVSGADTEITPRQQEILDILNRQAEASPRDIILQIDKKVTDRTLRSDLRSLKAKGLVDSSGKGRITKWFLKKQTGNRIRK